MAGRDRVRRAEPKAQQDGQRHDARREVRHRSARREDRRPPIDRRRSPQPGRPARSRTNAREREGQRRPAQLGRRRERRLRVRGEEGARARLGDVGLDDRGPVAGTGRGLVPANAVIVRSIGDRKAVRLTRFECAHRDREATDEPERREPADALGQSEFGVGQRLQRGGGAVDGDVQVDPQVAQVVWA